MSARSIDDQLAALDALKQQPSSPAIIEQLRKALGSKQNVIAAKAAAVADAINLIAELERDLTDACKRFLAGSDKGCLAKTAIIKAIAAAERGDEETFLVASQHVQMEPTWGGSRDAAVELRCQAVAALVRLNSRRMWTPLVRLLTDEDPQARATAARALGATGQDHARLLIHYKILIGDKEPSVMGECFGAHLRLSRSIELVEPFLHHRNNDIAEAAALALGESRLPPALEALRKRYERPLDEELGRIVLLAIAMTRQPAAVEFLLDVAREAPLKAQPVIEALAMYRSDGAVREKVREVCEPSQALLRLFAQHF